VAQIQSCPSQAVLEGLKDQLWYATSDWLLLFYSVGGLKVLVDAIEQHLAACVVVWQQQRQGGSSSSLPAAAAAAAVARNERPAAADALAIALECTQLIMQKPGGCCKFVYEQPR
jgi:hypothetical protein